MAERTEEQEQVTAVSKVSRRDLRTMLRRWELLDLDEWEPLGGVMTLAVGTSGIRLYDDDVDVELRKEVEEGLLKAARLLATELELTQPVFLISEGRWPDTRLQDSRTLLTRLVASAGITRAFGGAIRADSLTTSQILQLMEDVTRGTIYAHFDCSVVAASSQGPLVWSPCHHADVHVFTDGSQWLAHMVRRVASTAGLLVTDER